MRKSIDPMQDSAKRGTPTVVAAPRTHRLDEFPVGYSFTGCSPAEPASASPTGNDSQQSMLPYNDFSANGNNPLNSVSQPKGALQSAPFPCNPIPKTNPTHLARAQL